MIQLELEMPLSKVLIEDNDDSPIKNSEGFVPIDYHANMNWLRDIIFIVFEHLFVTLKFVKFVQPFSKGIRYFVNATISLIIKPYR